MPVYILPMSLNIKDPEALRLARELARRTGETMTKAVIVALRDRLRRETAKSQSGLVEALMEIAERGAKLPRLTDKSVDELLYDEHGLPR
jgi:antitoxin VapB